MNSLTPTALESLSYWVRLDDLVPIPDIENRLIEHARRGLLLRRANEDPTDWIEQSELLLRDVDFEPRRRRFPRSERTLHEESWPGSVRNVRRLVDVLICRAKA